MLGPGPSVERWHEPVWTSYAEAMKTIHLTDGELRLVRNAMHAYLNSFGHNEADVRAGIKEVIARLSEATDDHEPSELIG